jgi:hypothetical protein
MKSRTPVLILFFSSGKVILIFLFPKMYKRAFDDRNDDRDEKDKKTKMEQNQEEEELGPVEGILRREAEVARREVESTKEKQEQASPAKLSGPNFDLSANEVLNWLRGLQSDKKKLNSRAFHYTKHEDGYMGGDRDGDVRLCGRKQTISFIVEKMMERKNNFEKELKGQKTYPIPVCCGLSGLGKTRLLDEYPTFFRLSGIKGATAGVLVHYANGHSKQQKVLGAEAGFAWRLLHRVFLEENGPEFELWYSARVLPQSGTELTLSLAIDVIYQAAVENALVREGEILSLFLGIDEYQMLSIDSLKELVQRLQDCKVVGKVRLYPLFAGTDWRKGTIANSSAPDTKRVPLPLMFPRDAEDAISSIPQWRDRLSNDDFRRNLFCLGGMPRAVVEFGATGKFGEVWETRVINNWNMDSKSFILLVAQAMSGLSVTVADSPRLKVQTTEGEEEYNSFYSWRKLADMGICILVYLDKENALEAYVQVPYCVFLLASRIKGYQGSLAEKCLIQNLSILRDDVDLRTFATEPWQLWEIFGACFHALRINAFLILGHTAVSFKWICDGANINGCDHEVSLCPMEVRALEEAVGPKSSPTLSEKSTHKPLRYHKESPEEIWFVFINGANGPAIDVFFCLPLHGSSGVLFCGDQRKYSSTGLGQWRASDLLQGIHNQAPPLPPGSRVVAALFSLFPSFNMDGDVEGNLPADSFIVSFTEHPIYHGSLAYHPASSPCIDVNRCGVEMLKKLTSIAAYVDRILEQRPFSTLKDFQNFCGGTLSKEDAERAIVYGSS